MLASADASNTAIHQRILDET